MFGRRAKAGVLVAALLVLAVEGVLLIRYYERYYGSDAPSSSAPAFEDTMPEGTMPEETTASGDVPSDDSGGDYTYLSDPAIDGDPNAIVLVTVSADQGSDGAATYGHNVGVWYDFVGQKRWAIFNQDRAPVPTGVTFRVVLPPASESFVHRAGPVNTVGNSTYLDDPLTDGEPDAVVSVTQNWNPGGGAGVYNDHPVGVFYDEDVGKWAIYNRDGVPMPTGAAFNVAASGSHENAR